MKVWLLAWCLLLVIAGTFAEDEPFVPNVSIRERIWGRGRRLLGFSEELPGPHVPVRSSERKLLDADPGVIASIPFFYVSVSRPTVHIPVQVSAHVALFRFHLFR